MNDASRLKDGQAHYSALLTPQGTFVDDILVHRLSDNDYLLVVNAGTTDKDYAWIRKQVGRCRESTSATIRRTTRSSRCRGPAPWTRCKKLTKVDLAGDQELLVHVGNGGRHPQCADRPHGLFGRRRI